MRVGSFTMSVGLLSDIVAVLRPFVSSDPERSQLSCIVIDVDDDEVLRFAATDSYKMALVTLAPLPKSAISYSFEQVGVDAKVFAAMVSTMLAAAPFPSVDVTVVLDAPRSTNRRGTISMDIDAVIDMDAAGVIRDVSEADQFSITTARRLLDREETDDVPVEAHVRSENISAVLMAAERWGGTAGPLRLTQRTALGGLRLSAKRHDGLLEMMLMPMRVLS